MSDTFVVLLSLRSVCFGAWLLADHPESSVRVSRREATVDLSSTQEAVQFRTDAQNLRKQKSQTPHSPTHSNQHA